MRYFAFLLALALSGCMSARERSIDRFIRGEILSEEIERRNEAQAARLAAEKMCGGSVELVEYEDGTDPNDWRCLPHE